MKVLIIPSWFHNKNNPVRGSFILDQAIALKDSGVDVSIAFCELVPLGDLLKYRQYRITQAKTDGVKVYSLFAPSFFSQKRKTWFQRSKRFYDRLLSYIFKRERFDVIHCHSFVPAAYAATSLKNKYNVPIVYTEHYGRIQTGLSPYFKNALIESMKRSDAIVSVSNCLRNAMLFESKLNVGIAVVPNVLGDQFRNIKRNTSNNKARIITVGGFNEGKRHELTIRAFHKVFCDVPNACLTMVGQGVLENKLKMLVEELGETERVFFTGQLSRNDVALKLQSSSFFVLPSSNETFGVSYIEALACGIPVIGTRCGGFEEIYFDNCGEIVDVDDFDGLCKAMKKTYDNLSMFDGEYLSNTVRGRYGKQAFANKMLEIYYKVLATK